MPFMNILRKAVVTVAAGASFGLLASTVPAYAQLQVVGASPPVDASAPELTPSKRLVLHDVRVRDRQLSIDPASQPVLDYAVKMLRQYPEALVYVSGQGDRATVEREAKAVARYLEERGISANRLVLSNPVGLSQVDQRNPSASDASSVVLNFMLPRCDFCS
jgi:outer membrane protein OmpA-like peptidoglycan-associated protein